MITWCWKEIAGWWNQVCRCWLDFSGCLLKSIQKLWRLLFLWLRVLGREKSCGQKFSVSWLRWLKFGCRDWSSWLVWRMYCGCWERPHQSGKMSFDRRSCAEEMRLDCLLLEKPESSHGFSCWLVTNKFSVELFKEWSRGFIEFCRWRWSWPLSEDLSWTFTCCSLSETAFEFGFWYVFDWSIAGCDWLWLLLALHLTISCNRWVNSLT